MHLHSAFKADVDHADGHADSRTAVVPARICRDHTENPDRNDHSSSADALVDDVHLADSLVPSANSLDGRLAIDNNGLAYDAANVSDVATVAHVANAADDVDNAPAHSERDYYVCDLIDNRDVDDRDADDHDVDDHDVDDGPPPRLPRWGVLERKGLSGRVSVVF